jgi:glycosyltransferase involved in cell wall biosynthesis
LSVYPSIAEGFGIPPLEAIAASVSSVCSNTTAMADFNFMSEYLFDPHDKKAIKKAIELALSKPIDSNLKKNLLEKYNWKDSLSNLIERIKSEDVGN